MTTRRDIELLISARDQTGRTFNNVAQSIRSLNETIDQQVQAAGRGEIALDELRASQRALADVGRDLAGIQQQIDGFRRLTDSVENNNRKLSEAESALAAYRAELGTTGAETAAQERRLASLERKVETSGEAVRRSQADLAAQSQALEQAGVDTRNLDQAQEQIVASAREAGNGFTSLRGAISTYASDLREARNAERELAQANALDQKIAEATRLGSASQFVRLYAEAAQSAALADQQLRSLQGFQQVGQQAAEAARDTSRFTEAGQQFAVSSSQVAAGLREILQPGSQALNTLEGLEGRITTAAAAARDGADDIRQSAIAYNDLQEASARVLQLGALVDTFADQEAAVTRARAAFDQAAAEVEQYGLAISRADEPTEELVRALAQAERNLNSTGRALDQEERKLGELRRELQAADIDTENLADAQRRLGDAAQEAAAGVQAGSAGGRATLFGLDPFAIQQLSFQINDVVVGLASGQRPLTVLLQQGLQITQLFPRLNSGLVSFLGAAGPVLAIIGAILAALAPFAAAFFVVGNRVTALNRALAEIDLRGLSDQLNPDQVIKYEKELKKLTETSEEAGEVLSQLLEGVPVDQLDETIEGVTLLNQKLGIEAPEAAQLFIDAQNGGIEAVEELASATNVLTLEELDRIDALFESGDAEGARRLATELMTDALEKQASLTDSVWSPAIRNLQTAFKNLIGFFQEVAQPVIDRFNNFIEDAIIGFTFLTGLLAGKSFEEAQREAVTTVRPRGSRGSGGRTGATDQQIRDRAFERELESEVDATRELTNQERLRRAEIDARRRAQAAGVSQALEDRAVTQAIAAEQRKINQEEARGSRRRRSARSRTDREAARRQRRIERLQDQAERQFTQLDRAVAATGGATLEARLQTVDDRYKQIFDTLESLRDLGITQLADGTSLEEAEARIEAGKEILKQTERIQFFEEQTNLLIQQREDEIQNIVEQQQRGALSVEEAYREAEAVNNRISPQIVEAAQRALDIARAVAGTTPSPEMVSLIARLERIVTGDPTNNAATSVLTAGFTEDESRLNELLNERNNLVSAYNDLREIGLLTDQEAREKTAEAFNISRDEIQSQVDLLRQQVELLRNTNDELTGLPLLTETAYRAWLARLDAVEAGLVNIDQRIVQVNQAAEQGIANGVSNAFQTAADTIVGLVAGTLSFGDALDNVFTAGLSLVGSFLDAIAQVLVQMVALQAARAVIDAAGTGGIGGLFFHSGGVVGTGGSRRSRPGLSAATWLGAPKFHSGGGLGLRPDEYAAILQRGEEVITESDPRHVRNGGGMGGGGGGAAPSVRQVLLLEPEQVASAMQGKSGERAILTVIKANKPTIRQILE